MENQSISETPGPGKHSTRSKLRDYWRRWLIISVISIPIYAYFEYGMQRVGLGNYDGDPGPSALAGRYIGGWMSTLLIPLFLSWIVFSVSLLSKPRDSTKRFVRIFTVLYLAYALYLMVIANAYLRF